MNNSVIKNNSNEQSGSSSGQGSGGGVAFINANAGAGSFIMNTSVIEENSPGSEYGNSGGGVYSSIPVQAPLS
jgi:hypothetical protein